MEKNIEPPMISNTDSYSGIDNLEVMQLAHNYNRFLTQSALRSAPAKNNTWIDFGAGDGTYALQMRKSGKKIVCVEKDRGLQEKLKSLALEVKEDLNLFSESSVDYIYTFNVLEHIENDQSVINEFYRVLKPNHKVFIYVPAMQVLYSSMDKKVGHIRRYHRAELIDKIRNAGFTMERCQYSDSIGFFVTLLYKMIGNSNGSINRRSLMIYDRYLYPLNKISDFIFSRWLGKNLILVARKN